MTTLHLPTGTTNIESVCVATASKYISNVILLLESFKHITIHKGKRTQVERKHISTWTQRRNQ